MWEEAGKISVNKIDTKMAERTELASNNVKTTIVQIIICSRV